MEGFVLYTPEPSPDEHARARRIRLTDLGLPPDMAAVQTQPRRGARTASLSSLLRAQPLGQPPPQPSPFRGLRA
jgi:hypothetical protein